METRLGTLQTAVDTAMEEIAAAKVVKRIWQQDYTVWRPDPIEITNRLGWLHSATQMPKHTSGLVALHRELIAAGFTHVLLLGMGGSSLAPELFAKIFGPHCDGLQLQVLDSTDADQVAYFHRTLDLQRTLFIVATKSGGTVESLSFFKYFYNAVALETGVENAGDNFVAITDPGSKLIDIAQEYRFRDIFINDPNIGGRYSVLSYFGMLPAALVGVDVTTLLARAAAMSAEPDGALLGAIMGAAAKAGRDKLTLFTSPALASFADWAEQLIAESTGKEGRGILPVVGEHVGPPQVYTDDRLFVYLHLAGDSDGAVAITKALSALKTAGHPLVIIEIPDLLALGGQFFMWMFATAVTGYLLDIQPFDQPDVEAAKISARKMVAAYHETGKLPAGSSHEPNTTTLHTFFRQVKPGDYIAIQAYVQPTAATDAVLQALQELLRDRYKVATTIGYGPRFLHSTGQLHKGDGGNGLFVQLIGTAAADLPIPDKASQKESSMSFDVLKRAQALGDGEALQAAGRRFIRFDLGTAIVSGIEQLSTA